MTYELKVTETKNKAGKFHYQVVDEAGNVISERRSNREYVAATINGGYYFGRLDLIGKGDHGNYLKMCAGFHREYENFKWVWKLKPEAKKYEPLPIAYKKNS